MEIASKTYGKLEKIVNVKKVNKYAVPEKLSISVLLTWNLEFGKACHNHAQRNHLLITGTV